MIEIGHLPAAQQRWYCKILIFLTTIASIASSVQSLGSVIDCAAIKYIIARMHALS